MQVSAFGVKRRTSTKYKVSNPLWDELLFLNGKDLDREALDRTVITIGVYDMDTLSRDLVGVYTIDAMHVYYEPNHEVRRTWVALSAPHSARKALIPFMEDGVGGVQGYLRLSITLLGPGDKPVLHEDEPIDDGGTGRRFAPSAHLPAPFGAQCPPTRLHCARCRPWHHPDATLDAAGARLPPHRRAPRDQPPCARHGLRAAAQGW